CPRRFAELGSWSEVFARGGGYWGAGFARFFVAVYAQRAADILEGDKGPPEIYERFAAFMARAHVAGWRLWLLVEPLSEAATLGTGGLVLLLGLGIASFRQTSDGNWVKESDLAGTFLDRYGNGIGKRAIEHARAVRRDAVRER